MSVNQIAFVVFSNISNTLGMSEDLSKVLTIPEQHINYVSTL
jgi:hypothetical protein